MKKSIIICGISILVLGGVYFSQKKSVLPVPIQDDGQAVVVLADGRQCYTYSHDATADAPYTVHEFIDITIAGTKIIGTNMTNGYSGTITGTLENNSITDIFSYTVEGSQNKEKEVYRAGLVGIEKKRYPLIEVNGMLVPDTTKDFQILSYARIVCEASN